MNRLVQEIIKNFLPEEEKKQITALYAGGFKPPTAGHFEVVEEALKQNPEIEEFIIFIGSKERNGISQDESLIIWEIYKKYLPFKVKIVPSSLAPVRAVYDFAKNHPTREVLWVLGAREDNEEDFKDLASRTKSITNYPNIEVRTIITKGGVSGTAARNASKISLEKFIPFLPTVLTPEEKQEVFQIVSDKIQENIQSLKYTTPNFEEEWKEAKRYPELKRLGKDKWIELAKTGKPVTITSVEDINNTDADNPELFSTLNPEKQARALAQLEAGSVEMPIVALYSDGYKELLAGNTRLTAMMAKNGKAVVWQFNVPDQLNENSSYSQDIDVNQKIKELTQHMLQKGMNITPLPKVIFKHGDFNNAKQFLGKTAYYNPVTMEIVLYTEGRHPKDIVRSFSHEMIHHIQNLEDRLGNITTTNTQEDDHLDKIEQEANLRGTMTFRNWTDSLQEKKVKDPFGLNAYAMELGRLREEKTEYTIYCDMDSVLVDFDSGYKKLTGISTQQADANGAEAFWTPLAQAGAKFWITLDWMSDGKQLWSYIEKYNPILLSAPSREESSKLGKRVWVKRELPGAKLILRYASQKQEYASPTSILIDDRQKNIDQWVSAGGIGILHTSTTNTIEQLKQLKL